MRIALVATGGFDRSGRERVIPSLLWLTDRLSRQHTIVVYVLRYLQEPCRYQLAGATVQDLGCPAGLRRQYVALTRAIRADGPFDVIHGYWAHPAGFLAAVAARRRRIPSVVTCDSGEFVAFDDIGYGLQRTWRQRAAVAVATRLASRVTVCSHYQARLAARHGIRPAVIPLGVDLSVFGTPRPQATSDVHRLLTVASLNAVKDFDTLLSATRTLLDRGTPVRLDIVGEDTLGGRVQRRAEELGIHTRVVFHGFLPSDRLAERYRSADLFVLPSRHEAAGVVLLEAAASGVPVAGSRVGYLADWTPEQAVSVAPRDPAALAAAIDNLLADPGRRHEMAQKALQWARDHDADWSAARFDELYRELVTTRRHTPPPAPR
jgi:glycosyltransferase involved in cell wall biosynthesis